MIYKCVDHKDWEIPMLGQGDRDIAPSSRIWNETDVKENCKLFTCAEPCVAWHSDVGTQKERALLSMNCYVYQPVQREQCSNPSNQSSLDRKVLRWEEGDASVHGVLCP